MFGFGQRQPQLVPSGPRNWDGLSSFPAPTQAALHAALSRLRDKNVDSLTVLLLGRGGVGKSSTVNSIVGERVAIVNPFQQENARPQLIVRSRANFTLNIIDTPGLVEAGGLNDTSFATIKNFLEDKVVDAVLYVERLDNYRVDSLDKQVMTHITEKFGSHLWQKTILVLTHGQVSPPGGVSFQEFVSKRVETLRSAIKQAAGFRRGDAPEIPVSLVENTSRCITNADGEKVLGDGTVWLPALVNKMVDVALDEKHAAYTVPPEDKLDGNKKYRWAILPLFLIQVKVIYPLFRQLVKKDIQEADSVTRIEWGLPPAYIEKNPLRF